MIDVLELIYKTLVKNKFILKHCEGRIKYYSYPETFDEKLPFVIIEPLSTPEAIMHASDRNHYNKYLYQISVETQNRTLTKKIQQEIRQELYSLGFGQLGQGLDEFFIETNRYVDARRYEVIMKTNEWGSNYANYSRF